MQLVAVKRISGKLPVGAIFEEGGTRAKMLIAIGLAKPHTPAETDTRRGGRRRAPVDLPPPPVADPTTVTPPADPESEA